MMVGYICRRLRLAHCVGEMCFDNIKLAGKIPMAAVYKRLEPCLYKFQIYSAFTLDNRTSKYTGRNIKLYCHESYKNHVDSFLFEKLRLTTQGPLGQYSDK